MIQKILLQGGKFNKYWPFAEDRDMKLIVQTLQKINWAHLDLKNDLESRGLLNAEIEVETLYFLEMNLKIT